MEDPTLREHLITNASKGGKALLKKRGRKYFSNLVKKRWSKRKKKLPVTK